MTQHMNGLFKIAADHKTIRLFRMLLCRLIW